jgi:Tfp pilus assembly protein PilF
LRSVLAGEEKLLGAECYDIQVSLSNMALVYSEKGELDKAEETHRKVLRMRETLLGPQNPATLFSMANIAAVLAKKGEHDAAEQMMKKVRGRANSPENAGALLRAGLLFD